MSERPTRSHASSGSCIHASISASHDRRRSASNAAARRAAPGRDPGRALLGAARILHADLAARRGLGDPAPAVGVARQVGEHLGARPAGQQRPRGGLLVGEIADRAQHPAGPLANGFDVGDGRVTPDSASRSGCSPARSRRRARQALMPPSTVTVVPVAKPDASLARYSAAPTISVGIGDPLDQHLVVHAGR